MKEDTQKKLVELQSLLNAKKDIDEKIEKILNPEERVKVVLPSNFSYNSEILKAIQESGENGIAILTLVAELKKKFPEYGIDRKRVASGVAYLKNTKKEIESVGRSVYRAIKQNTSE